MQKITEYLKSKGVITAYLFGSRASGTLHDGSDWDIAVEFQEPKVGLEGLSRVAILEAELSKILEKPVDLIDLAQAHLTLLYECVWKGQCLFCPDDELRIQNELAVRRRFEDYQQIQAFYSSARRERLGQIL